MQTTIQKGQIYYINLPLNSDSIQGGERPCIVLGNEKACAYSPVLTIIPITSETKKYYITPFHVWITGLKKKSYAQPEQVQTISKNLIKGEPVRTLTDKEMEELKAALLAQIGF